MANKDIIQLKKYFDFCFPIQSKSKVVLTVDPLTDQYVIDLLRASVEDLGCEMSALDCGASNAPYNAVPDKYLDFVNSFPYWIDLTDQMSVHTRFSQDFARNGGHYLALCGLTREGLTAFILNQDIENVLRIIRKLLLVFRKGKELYIKSGLGTDIKCKILKHQISFTKVSELISGRNTETMLYGYVIIPIDLDDIDGVLVAKDYIWPPNDLRILKEPITAYIKNGKICQIQKSGYSKSLIEWMDAFKNQRIYEVAHLIYGILPGISISDSLVMNERVSGMLTFGFGRFWEEDYPPHLDICCSGASIWVGDVCVQDRGKLLSKYIF